MERNQRTIVANLSIGDRFYKLADKSKKVFQMVEAEKKQTQYQTYKYWCCEATIMDSAHLTEQMKMNRFSAIKGDTSVVYLRSVNTKG